MLRMLKVSGDSLLPTFRQGDYVLVSRLPVLLGRVRAGDVLVFRHAAYGTMIKQVDQVLAGDRFDVVGSHPGSVDSRRFGPVSKGDLIGRVVWHLKRPAGKRSAGRLESDNGG